MPRRRPTQPGTPPQPQASPSIPRPVLTATQVDGWAELIADGRDAFPDDLPPHDEARLRDAVRRRLRDRLVTLIARAIAAQIRRDRTGPEASSHA
ncbi:MAG: hypothetical protein WKF75_02535 [Singulisphaera sp.]